MNPEQNKPLGRMEEMSVPPDMIEQPTQPVQIPVETPKKSHKRAIVFALLGLVLIAAALAAYILYFQTGNPVVTTETTQQPSAAPVVSPVDTATNILDDGVTDEDKLTSTDDSSDIDDASKAAGNVGDGVNENNF